MRDQAKSLYQGLPDITVLPSISTEPARGPSACANLIKKHIHRIMSGNSWLSVPVFMLTPRRFLITHRNGRKYIRSVR